MTTDVVSIELDKVAELLHEFSSLIQQASTRLTEARLYSLDQATVLELDGHEVVLHHTNPVVITFYPNVQILRERHPQMQLDLKSIYRPLAHRIRVADDLVGPSDRSILSGISRGLSNKEIGLELNLAQSTVKNRLSRLYRQLHVTSRLEAMMVAGRMGLS